MSKTTGATFLTLILVAAGVFGAHTSLSKPVTKHAVLAEAAIVADTAPLQSATYNGRHSDWVRKLLNRVGAWKCRANTSDSGTPPSVKVDACLRDKYVVAAVLYAWAAEC